MTAAADGPLVSVLIAAYNAARYLGEAIASALAQTYSPIEVIVVDDGSEDGTAMVAKRYEPRVIYAYQTNAGIGAARNRGVEMARGSHFAFLDADDRFVVDKLERQMEAFGAHPELDIVFGHVREFVSPELVPAVAARLRPPVEDSPWPTHNLAVVTREGFQRVGPFSTSLKVGVGVDWCARVGEQGLKSLMLPAVVLERRLHAENNGIRQKDSRLQYVQVLRASIARRRRMAAQPPEPAPPPAAPRDD